MRGRESAEPRVIAMLLLCLLVLVLLVCRVIMLEQRRSEEKGPVISVLMADDTVHELDLESYIIGVVAAEMPASFNEEALRAQAVAARTYALSHCPPYGAYRHEGAAVCCRSEHCQAYADEAALRQKWGQNYAAYYARIEEAVQDTAGEILFWRQQAAQTPFCSTCGGSSESAAACWGGEYPYLLPVDCRFCRSSPRFCGYRRLTINEAASALAVSTQELAEMYIAGYTPGGRVDKLCVGAQEYAGTKIRSLLGLDSAVFSWLILGDSIVFTTLGYGHGVGMCQYGADGMGKQGYDHRQILAHYYPGTATGQAKLD